MKRLQLPFACIALFAIFTSSHRAHANARQRVAAQRVTRVFNRQSNLPTKSSHHVDEAFDRHELRSEPSEGGQRSMSTVKSIQGKPFAQIVAHSTRGNLSRTESVTQAGSQHSAISSVARQTSQGSTAVNRWQVSRRLLGGLIGTSGETVVKTERDAANKVTGATVLRNRKYLTLAGMKVLPIGRNLQQETLKGFVK